MGLAKIPPPLSLPIDNLFSVAIFFLRRLDPPQPTNQFRTCSVLLIHINNNPTTTPANK